MPLPHELHAGDVVALPDGSTATVHSTATTSVDSYALVRLTFADGSSLLCAATQNFPRLYPQNP